MTNPRLELICDSFQNFKKYNIPKAQLVIADIPYNLGVNAYGSRPEWYINGDNKQGESKKAGKAFFYSDFNFNIAEFFHFSHKMLKKEPKARNEAPAMIVFCAFQQANMVIEYGKKHGFKKSYPIFFVKNTSSQVLKANMKIVGATEIAMVLYRDKLPKFRNGKTETKKGRMIKNWFEWKPDDKKEYPKIHPTQKPVGVLKELIEIFTDEGDVVIDPVAGSGSTLVAAYELGRQSYGFECHRKFVEEAENNLISKSIERMKVKNNQIKFAI